MSQLVTECPACRGALRVTRLGCDRCGTQLEGNFTLPSLLRLDGDELAFVLMFVKASGSLKEVARLRGQSYPTIRNRLDQIIAKLEAETRDPDAERHAVLDAIARGKMTAEEGARRLKEIES